MTTCWMRAQAATIPEDSSTADAYLESDNFAVANGYVSVMLWYDDTAADIWHGFVGGPPEGSSVAGSPIFLEIGGQTVLFWTEYDSGALQWKASHYYLGQHYSPFLGEARPNVCQTLEAHLVNGSAPVVRVNGAEYTFPQTNSLNFQRVRIGLEYGWNGTLNDDTDQVVYITNVKVGTTGWGSSDLLDDGFGSGTINPSDWFGAYAPPLTATCAGPRCGGVFLNPQSL